MRLAGLTLVTAESMTGGMIGAAITAIPGASDVYWGGIISYSKDAKERLLGVDPLLIAKFGVVSRETVEAMAFGALAVSSANISVAVTGLAGPGGGSPEIPAGTVWIAAAKKNDGTALEVESKCLHLCGTRSSIRSATVYAAASLILSHLDR